MTLADQITSFVDREFARETRFLAELVKVPSDNPPGDCAIHAARAKELLEQLGLAVEAHPVPQAVVEAVGPKWLLDQGLTKPYAVIAAGFAYAVVNAHNGCLHLEVTVTGRQAHAAMPDTGVDALEATTVILTALYAHRGELARTRSSTPDI